MNNKVLIECFPLIHTIMELKSGQEKIKRRYPERAFLYFKF